MSLRRRVDAYLRRSRMTATRFGREAVNDPRFVFDLRKGREPRRKTVLRVWAWLDQNDQWRPAHRRRRRAFGRD